GGPGRARRSRRRNGLLADDTDSGFPGEVLSGIAVFTDDRRTIVSFHSQSDCVSTIASIIDPNVP
ncbi:MAG: hypothetical protein ACOCY7_04670, partial [Halodesulfurarchaeum sp.]